MPENFETGEYKVQGTAEFDELEPTFLMAFTGDTIGGNVISQNGFSYNGIFSSVTFIFGNIAGFNTLLNLINQDGNGDKILCAFTLPRLALLTKIQEIEASFPPDATSIYYFEPLTYNYNQTPIIKNLISTPSTLDGYNPRNQKLRTYPFLYIGFNPANGNSKIYRYEDFTNGTPSFKLISEINQNPTVAFIPQNYRGETGDSLSDIAYLNGYPTLSYKTDVFNTWLAQNTNQIELQKEHENFNYELNNTTNFLNSYMGTIGNIASLNPSGAMQSISKGLINGLQNEENHEYYIKNQMAQIEKQSLLPDNANLSSSNATLLGYNMLDKNIFTRYSIKREFAEKIDKYFDMYGYLTNTLKLPNLTNRPNWNYVKTIGSNILANIPQMDLLEIKQMFDNGITLWHNTSTFLDYSQNNR